MEHFYEVMYRYEAKIFLDKLGCTDIKWFYLTYEQYKMELHPLVYVLVYLRQNRVATVGDIFKLMNMKSFTGAEQYHANFFFNYLILKLNFDKRDIDTYDKISQILTETYSDIDTNQYMNL